MGLCGPPESGSGYFTATCSAVGPLMPGSKCLFGGTRGQKTSGTSAATETQCAVGPRIVFLLERSGKCYAIIRKNASGTFTATPPAALIIIRACRAKSTHPCIR